MNLFSVYFTIFTSLLHRQVPHQLELEAVPQRPQGLELELEVQLGKGNELFKVFCNFFLLERKIFAGKQQAAAAARSADRVQQVPAVEGCGSSTLMIHLELKCNINIYYYLLD